jgi:ATP-binding cassette subfamily B protein
MTVLALVQPLLIKQLVDAITARQGVHAVLLVGATYAAYQLGRGGLSMVARVRQAHLAQRVALTVRHRLYAHVLRLCPLSEPCTTRGELLFRLTTDVRSVESFFARVVVQSVGVALAVAGALVGLMMMDVRLAAVAVLTVPVFLATTRRGRERVTRRAAEAMAAQSSLTALLNERVGALEAVQIARREPRERRAAYRAGREFYRTSMEAVRANSTLWGGVELVTGLTAALVLTLGAVGVTRGLLTLGSLLAFHLYVQHLFSAIDTAAAVAGMAAESLAGVRRVAHLLAQRPAVAPGGVRALPRASAAEVELQKVSFAYPGKDRILHDLSVRIAAGEHVAIVGRSGCGKSTLVRLLARFFDPEDGQLLLDGVDLRALDLHALRAAVAFTPQVPTVFAGTLAENIAFAPGATRVGVEEAARLARLDVELVERLAERAAGEAGAELSGGQRQRLALARLFREDPRVVVLDEPTSAVDARTERELWKAIREFSRDRTLIAITHNLKVAADFPRVLVLDGGRLVADGPPARLLAGELSYGVGSHPVLPQPSIPHAELLP